MSCVRRDSEKVCVFLGFLLCALFYSFSEAGFRFLSVSWFFLLTVIIGASQSVPLPNSRRRGPLRPASIASGEMPARRAPGARLLSHGGGGGGGGGGGPTFWPGGKTGR